MELADIPESDSQYVSDGERAICDHRDIDRIIARLNSPKFLRSLSPSQLPSQAVSSGEQSPITTIENQLASLDITHLDSDAQSDNLEEWTNNIGLREKKLLEMAVSQGYFTFEQSNPHRDLVLAVDFNFYGTRMVTASSDHKLKVLDRKDDRWDIVDTWTAHDAEITDVKWNGPFMGEVFGSIAEDGRFRLWQENSTEIPNFGRRFSCIFEISSETRVPFMSLDFKNIMTETWVALVTRDGYLTVYEPVDHENLSDWRRIYGQHLEPTPDREDETSFKVAFHKEKTPSWAAVRAGLDRNALSLAVAAMHTVKIFRAYKDGAYRFYLAAELTGARNLVRDVAWANGSMRGWDFIATGSKDGCVRIYELKPDAPGPGTDAITAASLPEIREPSNIQGRTSRNAPSGIGAGLASGSGRESYRDTDSSSGRIKEIATKTEELNLHRGAVWRVAFSQGGEVLLATGDDGAVITWKRALDGRWLEYAEVDVSSD